MTIEAQTLNSPSDAAAIIDAARHVAPARIGAEDRFYAAAVPSGAQLKVVDLEIERDKFADRPRRKQGTYRVQDSTSFIAYMAKHALPESEVWADATRFQVVAVVNAHMGQTGDGVEDYAGWADHRVSYAVQYTEAWKAWAALDGKLLGQSEFAEHIEDRAIDVQRPNAAEMLELAQHFEATTGGVFESSKILSSGERQFTYKETIDAKAGRTGQLEIPKDFELALIPFEGAPAYKVTARLRYRIDNGHLRIGYRLERPNDICRQAFLDVVEEIENGIEAPLFRGVSA